MYRANPAHNMGSLYLAWDFPGLGRSRFTTNSNYLNLEELVAKVLSHCDDFNRPVVQVAADVLYGNTSSARQGTLAK